MKYVADNTEGETILQIVIDFGYLSFSWFLVLYISDILLFQ